MGTWATAEIIRFWWQLGSSYVRVRVGLQLWIRLGGVRTTLGFLRPWPGHIPCVPKKTVVPNFGDNFVKS